MERTNSSSRRDFLKLSGTAGAAVTVAAAELVAGKEGIDTPYGNFRFLYERHDVGIKSEDIPASTDIFYRELTLGGDLFRKSAAKIFSTRYAGGEIPIIPAKEISFLPPEVIVKLAQNRIEIMIGDVDLRNVDYLASRVIRGAEFGVGSYTLFAQKTETSESTGINKGENPRRKFLKTAATLGAVWAMSPTISFALNMFGAGTPEQTAFKRVASRLEGIQSHFHPELASNFFRDAMTANKLLAAGEEYERSHGTRANFTVLLAAGHSGVEDLIRFGSDVKRAMVVSWPTGILEGIIENNNGIEDFSSARIFKLPDDMTSEDVLNGGKWSTVTERRVTDHVLVEELQRKLQN